LFEQVIDFSSFSVYLQCGGRDASNSREHLIGQKIWWGAVWCHQNHWSILAKV